MKSSKKKSPTETRIVKHQGSFTRRSSLRKINESTRKLMRRFSLSSRRKQKKQPKTPQSGKEDIITNSFMKIRNDIPNLLHSFSSMSESTLQSMSRNLMNNQYHAAILLVDPKSRVYEILSCQLDEFDDAVPVTHLLEVISKSSTDKILKNIEYTGIMNLSGTEFPSEEPLKKHTNGGEVLIAKDDSVTKVEYLDLANSVLENPKLVTALRAQGISLTKKRRGSVIEKLNLCRLSGKHDKVAFDIIESEILEEDTTTRNRKNMIIMICSLLLMAHLFSLVF